MQGRLFDSFDFTLSKNEKQLEGLGRRSGMIRLIMWPEGSGTRVEQCVKSRRMPGHLGVSAWGVGMDLSKVVALSVLMWNPQDLLMD